MLTEPPENDKITRSMNTEWSISLIPSFYFHFLFSALRGSIFPPLPVSAYRLSFHKHNADHQSFKLIHSFTLPDFWLISKLNLLQNQWVDDSTIIISYSEDKLRTSGLISNLQTTVSLNICTNVVIFSRFMPYYSSSNFLFQLADHRFWNSSRAAHFYVISRQNWAEPKAKKSRDGIQKELKGRKEKRSRSRKGKPNKNRVYIDTKYSYS